MKKFLKINISSLSQEQMDVLISELADIGFYAFEQNSDELLGYISDKDFDENNFKATIPSGASYAIEAIENRNWNEEWESDFHPVVVGDFAAVRASFHNSIKNVAHEIIITPKMSFGTGHHATTFLMIESMQHVNFYDKSILDFGTGTGILAILSEKLGASSVTAVDNDEWSIINAMENISANESSRINVQRRDNIRGISNVDIIMANINLNVLMDNAGDLAKGLRDNASLLLISGILESDEQQIERTFFDFGLIKKETNLKLGWISILFGKQ